MATRRKPAASVRRVRRNVVYGSGNVFADLGLKNADELLVRAALLRRVTQIINERKLTQAKAAQLLGLKQPDVSALLKGRYLRRFSTDRLMRCLTALGQDVEIVVKPRTARKGQAQISVAMPG